MKQFFKQTLFAGATGCMLAASALMAPVHAASGDTAESG